MATLAEPQFVPTSHGYGLGSAPVGELRDASGLAGRPEALRARIAEDGYLLLRGVLDRDQVLAARAELCGKLDAVGLIDRAQPPTEAIYSGSNAGLSGLDRKAFAKDLRTGPALRTVSPRSRPTNAGPARSRSATVWNDPGGSARPRQRHGGAPCASDCCGTRRCDSGA